MTNKENIINLVNTIKSLFTKLVSNIKTNLNKVSTCLGQVSSDFFTCIENEYDYLETLDDDLSENYHNASSYNVLYSSDSGYIIFPDKGTNYEGLKIQWGCVEYDSSITTNGRVVTFPKAFTSECYNVVIHYGGNSTTTSHKHNNIYTPTNISVNSFTCYFNNGIANKYPELFPFYWRAIGY